MRNIPKLKARTQQKLPEIPEKLIESQILHWLNLQPGCKAWKNKSLGVFDPRRKVFLKNRSVYSEKGTSDILGIYRGIMLCIEVKSRKGKVQPHQAEFLATMDKLGAIAFVARSVEDVKAVLFEKQVLKFLDWIEA